MIGRAMGGRRGLEQMPSASCVLTGLSHLSSLPSGTVPDSQTQVFFPISCVLFPFLTLFQTSPPLGCALWESGLWTCFQETLLLGKTEARILPFGIYGFLRFLLSNGTGDGINFHFTFRIPAKFLPIPLSSVVNRVALR